MQISSLVHCHLQEADFFNCGRHWRTMSHLHHCLNAHCLDCLILLQDFGFVDLWSYVLCLLQKVQFFSFSQDSLLTFPCIHTCISSHYGCPCEIKLIQWETLTLSWKVEKFLVMKRGCLANTLESYVHLIAIEHEEVVSEAEPTENILYKIKGYDIKKCFSLI